MPSDSDVAASAGWRRYWHIGALALRRVTTRVRRGQSSRVLLAVGVVGIAIMLLVLVTGISLGVASQSTVYGENVDYWIVPDTTSTLTTVVTVDGPQLGDVHPASERLAQIAGVTHTTPVLIELVRVRTPQSERPEFVLGIGIIPSGDAAEISGLSTAELTAGDPYYNGGRYDGDFTGEVVLSPAAATLLDASAGEQLAAASPATGEVAYSYTVTGVSSAGPRRLGSQVPVAVFHLSELQTLTGAHANDQADQILVRTNEPGVKDALTRAYPDATVVSRTGLETQQLVDSDLPLAVALTALLISIGVSSLFIATTIGLEIEADRQLLALLGAIGFSVRDQLVFVAVTTLSITLLGGLLGVLLAGLGTLGLNYVVSLEFGVSSLVVFRPALVAYGLAVAVVTGLLALPYPLVLARRTNTLEELSR